MSGEVPEPYAVRGGPFDIKVSRSDNTVTLKVVGDKGDPITTIQFHADSLPRFIEGLKHVL